MTDIAMTDIATESLSLLAEHRDLADDEIVARVLGGEDRLFSVLMRRYNQRSYRVARSILKDDAEAEDAVQQGYLNAYVHLSTFEGRARFSTWLTRIVANEALERVRRRKLRDGIPERVTDAYPDRPRPIESPEDGVARRELGRLLEHAIDGLPDGYRAVVMLRDVEHLDTAETAQALGLSEENVRIRLHRARALLRDRLYDQVGESAPEVFSFAGVRCARIVTGVFARLAELPRH